MTFIVEIGSLREPVEVLDEPKLSPFPQIGRIKHANGENVAIDFETLDKLMKQAHAARCAAAEPPLSAGIFFA